MQVKLHWYDYEHVNVAPKLWKDLTSAFSKELGYVKTDVYGVVHDGYCSLPAGQQILFIQGGPGPSSHFLHERKPEKLRLSSFGF